MTTPSDADHLADDEDDDLGGTVPDPEPRTVRVPIRPGETAKVQADAARHWDQRLWSDTPPR